MSKVQNDQIRQFNYLNKHKADSLGTEGGMVTVITTPYTVTATDTLVVINRATATIVNLPASAGLGRQLSIANIGVGTVTVTASGANTIDGDATQELWQWDTMVIKDYTLGYWKIT
jgi:hypothetical protein